MNQKTKIRSFLTVIVIVGVFFANFSLSQETVSLKKESGGMGYSMFGNTTIDIKSLNNRLASKGYPTMSDNFFSVGGGGHGILTNKVIIGGEGQGLFGEEGTKGNFKTSFYGGYGMFNLGYLLYSVKEFRFYPLFGLGFGGFNLKIAENIGSISFDAVLEDPKRKVDLSKGGFLLNFAVGIDYLLKLGEDETGKAGFVIGFRAGYLLSPFVGDWYIDDILVSDAPDLSITGPYIRFMFGGGGIRKND